MGQELPWSVVRSVLADTQQRKVLGAHFMRQAAVAAIFRQVLPQEEGLTPTEPIPTSNLFLSSVELLLIRRAEKAGDPWSGHMAFPGGRMQSDDANPLAAAIRETQEEINLHLQQAGWHIATLSQQRAMALGKPIPLVITPFVFELKDPATPVWPNHEVAEVVWVPLPFFLEPNHRTTMMYRKMGIDWPLPCYQYQGRTIWGLTLRMIDEVLSRIQHAQSLAKLAERR